jgi:hypothetical protein
MDIKLAEEIIACLPRGKTMFRYHKHRYALLLLESFIGGSCPITRLRKTSLARLLDIPVVKKAMQGSGDGNLTREQLHYSYLGEMLPFLLTLDIWRGGMQISRKGVNLVLQLNFTNHHASAYHRLAKPDDDPLFRYACHPVMLPGKRPFFRETFAWARIDLDFETNEALIEEIQSDWTSGTARLKAWVEYCLKHGQPLPDRYGLAGSLEQVRDYLETILKPYLLIWDEAMLAASIDFIRRELGIDVIYYHHFETGRQIKKINWSAPPRSVYSKLPRKFCFKETENAPVFLTDSRGFRRVYRKIKNPRWFRLDLSAENQFRN